MHSPNPNIHTNNALYTSWTCGRLLHTHSDHFLSRDEPHKSHFLKHALHSPSQPGHDTPKLSQTYWNLWHSRRSCKILPTPGLETFPLTPKFTAQLWDNHTPSRLTISVICSVPLNFPKCIHRQYLNKSLQHTGPNITLTRTDYNETEGPEAAILDF